MRKASAMTVAAAVIAIAALPLAAPAEAGHRSAVGAGLVGFGIGAVLGSMMGAPEVYYVPPPYPRQRATPPAAYRQTAKPPPARAKTVKTAKTSPSAPTPAQINQAKFKAALSKAKRDGVHTLTEKDIDGLSTAQLKQIRGY